MVTIYLIIYTSGLSYFILFIYTNLEENKEEIGMIVKNLVKKIERHPITISLSILLVIVGIWQLGTSLINYFNENILVYIVKARIELE